MNIFLNIYSKGEFPANELSNFAHHTFIFDGVYIVSAESFLQSLKTDDPIYQKAICAMDARAAKALSSGLNRKAAGMLYWKGSAFSRSGREYQRLLNRFYLALAENSKSFSDALLASGYRPLWHSVGKLRRQKTCLTTFEFLSQLYRVRRIVRQRAKQCRCKDGQKK